MVRVENQSRGSSDACRKTNRPAGRSHRAVMTFELDPPRPHWKGARRANSAVDRLDLHLGVELPVTGLATKRLSPAEFLNGELWTIHGADDFGRDGSVMAQMAIRGAVFADLVDDPARATPWRKKFMGWESFEPADTLRGADFPVCLARVADRKVCPTTGESGPRRAARAVVRPQGPCEYHVRATPVNRSRRFTPG